MGGDFNCFFYGDDRIGLMVRFSEIVFFRDCTEKCELMDMKYNGFKYIWNNK